MRAHNIITISRGRRSTRRRRALALALGFLALAIPATASGEPIDGGAVIASGQGGSSQPAGDTDYSSVTSLAPPASEPSSPSPGGSPVSGSDYSTPNAIIGAPAGEPVLVSDSPSVAGSGFDWASALVGAGAALALAACGAAALLTLRRRPTVAPSTPTS